MTTDTPQPKPIPQNIEELAADLINTGKRYERKTESKPVEVTTLTIANT